MPGIPPPTTATLRNRHLPWLGLGVAVPLLAAALVVVDGERIAVCWFPDRPLPTTCLARRLLDVNCPTCGLTRSTVHLIQGNVSQSFAMHRFGWLVCAWILLQVPYRLACLWWKKEGLFQWSRAAYVWWSGLAALLLVNRLGTWSGLW